MPLKRGMVRRWVWFLVKFFTCPVHQVGDPGFQVEGDFVSDERLGVNGGEFVFINLCQ